MSFLFFCGDSTSSISESIVRFLDDDATHVLHTLSLLVHLACTSSLHLTHAVVKVEDLGFLLHTLQITMGFGVCCEWIGVNDNMSQFDKVN